MIKKFQKGELKEALGNVLKTYDKLSFFTIEITKLLPKPRKKIWHQR